MNRSRIVFLYSIFAAISIAANLATQKIFLMTAYVPYAVAMSVLAETAMGLAVKFFLCVFRTNVTGRFGIVTGDFGNVTWHSGNVTERTEGRIGVAHDINHAGYARRLLPERACPRTG